MATFFGEIVLPSSRVFFDNDDSDFEDDDALQYPRQKSEFKITEHFKESLNLDYKQLIITDGTVSKGFADLYLLGENTKTLAEINLIEDETKEPSDVMEVKRPKAQPTVIYSIDSSTRVLNISDIVDLSNSNNLLLKLENFIKKSDNVVLLCNRSITDYRCDSRDDLPHAFMRTLMSSKVPPSQNHTILEQPNFISGFSASVLAWCECLDKYCELYICYSDKYIADSITVGPFVELFKELASVKHLLKKPTMKLPNLEEQSYMYM